MTLAASDIKLLYTQGPATGRPTQSGASTKQLAAHSLGGNPLNPATSNSFIPAFSAPQTNIENIFDSTLEDENEGSSGTFVNYRALFIYNDTADETENFEEVLYRASLFAPRTLDSNTVIDVAVLAKTAALYNAIPNASKASEPANESTLPTIGDTNPLAFRTLPATAATATPLTITGTGTVDLARHEFIGIVLRRTVTKVAAPAGSTESLTLSVRGGTPTS